MRSIKTTHDLPFEVAPWKRDPSGTIKLFRIGTCHGQWFVSHIAYCILSIENNEKGNGHLEDVFEWFENSCRRDNMPLMIMDFFNEKFKAHCIDKRGFTAIRNSDHVVKYFI